MSQSLPAYFELSWSILSTLGLMSCGISISVAGIVGFNGLSAVPIITSAAGAIANGLCYYAFYSDYPTRNRVVAGAFADIAWLFQEAGLGFYSYQILRRVLLGEERKAFHAIFWVLMSGILGVRIAILMERALSVTTGDDGSYNLSRQGTIDQLHVAYFVLIAVMESASAFFLLRIFGRGSSTKEDMLGTPTTSLFSIVARSTEVRLALLGLVGITRSITYSFQASAQSATNTASQLDRFAYTLECAFPMILIVDLLASKRLGQEYMTPGGLLSAPSGWQGRFMNSLADYDGGVTPQESTPRGIVLRVTRVERVEVLGDEPRDRKGRTLSFLTP
ncbi:hypothetical protein BDN72DRAFT_44765 [Pluteus cervinus]|uniref:Uncharacterized protein n=1 Tax=Pluteus cervinus TaxID=181527 RepID=A0ACD3BIC1_9AGAR|nr:hypothetical protein BDN72DRAFT_44765 [Pluteus cervinus]